MKRWFKETIEFSCTACGKCCKSKGSNKVYLNDAETYSIAEHLRVSTTKFDEVYTDQRIDVKNRLLKTIKQHSIKKQCLFLVDNKCSIYEVRPTQCRTYPFWPQIMIGPAEWTAEAHLCEGIKTKVSLPTDTLMKEQNLHDKESTVPLNMLIHHIHDRGKGEDWTYDQALELLNETKAESPDIFEDFLDVFFDSNESRIGRTLPINLNSIACM